MRPGRRLPPESATRRLSRLLALVPYLVSRQGIPLTEVAAEFGITESQLVKDLELLFVCGTPGHLPDDLIEVDWDDGRVYLGNADPIARPLRLDVDERPRTTAQTVIAPILLVAALLATASGILRLI